VWIGKMNKNEKTKTKTKCPGSQWLMPVILVNWKVEILRILV
jgi:hypothetical protein